VDFTGHARSLLGLARQLESKEKRATHKQLADAFLKANKTAGLDREAVERFLNQLVSHHMFRL
jgi:hypothetical protein